jgi:hypothetical protein
MAKSFVDHKARTGIPDAGSKLKGVTNAEEWGARKAVERYGQGVRTFPPPKDASAPQDPMDKRGPDTGEVNPNSWLRGGHESSEQMPNFDHSKKGRR